MFISLRAIRQGILIGSGIFLCSSILIISIYLLYRYRKNSFYFRQKLNSKQAKMNHNEETKTNNFKFHKLKTTKEMNDPLVHLNHENRFNSIGTTPTIIEELMRKSLQLAKTAEKVADEKEKRISLKEKIQIGLES